MKQDFKIILFLMALICVSSCAILSENKKEEYGILKSAVMFSADKVIGEYGDEIPDNFNNEKFMALIENKIPEDYYLALKKYNLRVNPKGYYYLLEVFQKDNMILFDYSCTPELDGPIISSEIKFDLENLEKYNHCE